MTSEASRQVLSIHCLPPKKTGTYHCGLRSPRLKMTSHPCLSLHTRKKTEAFQFMIFASRLDFFLPDSFCRAASKQTCKKFFKNMSGWEYFLNDNQPLFLAQYGHDREPLGCFGPINMNYELFYSTRDYQTRAASMPYFYLLFRKTSSAHEISFSLDRFIKWTDYKNTTVLLVLPTVLTFGHRTGTKSRLKIVYFCILIFAFEYLFNNACLWWLAKTLSGGSLAKLLGSLLYSKPSLANISTH